MTYTLQFESVDEVSPADRKAAEQRFRGALEESLGDAALVAPIYTAYLRIVQAYGEDPSPEVLSDSELEILTQWRIAESAAVAAAFGPHRYMEEARFQIVF